MDDEIRTRLSKLRSECGCRSGSVALLVSIGAYVIYAVWFDTVMRSRLERIITGFCIGLAGAVIGKLVGMLWARYQYRRLFTDRVHSATPPTS
jgi:hypothetical protein